ncbi:hypothetical protein G5C65_33565, partial [Streptomyces sp. SB3404]|nr:hypothetical protein [Streptomyces boncukensis]
MPARDQLARQARASLVDAVRLARWAAHDGTALRTFASVERAATELGIPARQVRTHWDRARLAGLVELHGEPGGEVARAGWRLRAWDRDDSAVLRGWVALFDAWSLAYPAPAPHEQGLVAEIVEAVPQFLSVMHLSGGPVTVAMLHDLLAQRVAELRAGRTPEAPPDGAGQAQGQP